jgi:hypothetical protein
MKITYPQLPWGIVLSKFRSILGLYHNTVTTGHHGQQNDQRKCVVRLWNHGWDAEYVCSSGLAGQWRWILEEHMGTVQRLTPLIERARISRTLYCQLFKTCLQISCWPKYVCTWLIFERKHNTSCSFSYPRASWSHHDYP